MVNDPLGSQRCNIVRVSNDQALLGNFGVGALDCVLTERLGQTFMAEEAFSVFARLYQRTYHKIPKLLNK